MLSGLLDVLYRNIYLIVIGKVFSAKDLGYYTRAHQFSEFPSSNLTGILQRVTYPVLCKIQDDDARLAGVYRRFLRVSAFLIFPLLVGLSAVAEPLVLVLLKEQWLFAAVLLKIICFAMMWYPIHSINLNLLQVKGRSDLFLRLEVIKKIIGVVILCATLPFGLVAMCWGQILSSILGLVINTYYTGKLIQVGFIRQMKDLFPALVLSLAMWLVVTGVQMLVEPAGLKLAVGILAGILSYADFPLVAFIGGVCALFAGYLVTEVDHEQRALPPGIGKSLVRIPEGSLHQSVHKRDAAAHHGIASVADYGRGDYDALQLCGDDACPVVERHQAGVCGH